MEEPQVDAADQLADLVVNVRPGWDRWVVASIARDLARRLPLGDLAVAYLRAANNPDLPHAKSVLWKGNHWDHVKPADRPTEVVPLKRCGVCGKREDACRTQRPGPDEHTFEPVDRV